MLPDFAIDGTTTPLREFDAVEVQRCAMDDDGNVECIGYDEAAPEWCTVTFWSVYLHFDVTQSDGRGCVCIADVPEREAAFALARGVEAALRSVIGDRIITLED
jgi:hypothetical protein